VCRVSTPVPGSSKRAPCSGGGGGGWRTRGGCCGSSRVTRSAFRAYSVCAVNCEWARMFPHKPRSWHLSSSTPDASRDGYQSCVRCQIQRGGPPCRRRSRPRTTAGSSLAGTGRGSGLEGWGWPACVSSCRTAPWGWAASRRYMLQFCLVCEAPQAGRLFLHRAVERGAIHIRARSPYPSGAAGGQWLHEQAPADPLPL
jgi:hypothetical protein